jgi:excisionase family DNA binding protein
MHKTVLTTGEVAKICNVAPRTVSKWFDSGQLRGYRIPGSKDRRIPIDQLLRFMRAHGIPLNGLDTGRRRVLILDRDPAICEALQRMLEADAAYEVATAGSAMEAGALAHDFKPHVMVVDVGMPGIEASVVVRFFRASAELQDTRLVAMAPALGAGPGQALLQQGFAAYLSKPFDLAQLRAVLNHAPAESMHAS